jgi:Ni,Fe-hydrogenase III small subunit
LFVLLRHLQNVRREIALPASKRAGSLALRHVDAGSCNGCEHELAATANPYYDLQRHGLNIVASPRHADVLLVTGQITIRMVDSLRRAYEAMPEPRLVVALGDCATGCTMLGDPRQLAGPLEEILPVDLRIPGCPPAPQKIAEELLGLMRDMAEHSTTRRAFVEEAITPPTRAVEAIDTKGAKHA